MTAETELAKTPQQRWLMILRLVISTFLLITLIIIKTHGNVQDVYLQWFEPGLAALALYYLLAVIYYHFPGRGRRTAAFHQWTQILADLALAICLTMITGGGDSPLSFLFIIAIINGAFLGGIRTALVVATFSAALWGGIISLQDSGRLALWLPELGLNVGQTQSTYVALSGRLVRILINTGACYLVAFLSGHLAGQLFISRRALVRSQAHLDRLAELNENIIQSIDSGLITMDQSGLILSVNRAGLEIMGLSPPELVGRPWQLFFPQLEHILPRSPRDRPALFDAGGLRFEYPRASDGRELTLELNVLALKDTSGGVWGRLFVLKDLTSLSQMEEAVHKAENLAALGELAAGLAHELRTPLTSMTGAWHMLSEQNNEPEDQQRLISIIGREMERLAKLTNDFLSFARPARSTPRPFDLNALVTDQLRVFVTSIPEKVRVDSRLATIPPAYFDQDQFSQVLWNLLSNAVEAGDQAERLQITVETDLDPTWPDHVVLRVCDDGPGIPHENLTKMFEPFFTTKSTGNGLGLATVSRILHEGHGHITVSSVHRGLTTFTILLPRAGASLSSRRKRSAEAA